MAQESTPTPPLLLPKKRGRPKKLTTEEEEEESESDVIISQKMRESSNTGGKNKTTVSVANEKYSHWKSVVPILYDWLANHNLVWPSLSCRWGPLLEQSKHKNKQRLYLSEQTDGSVPNTLVIANCDVVKPKVAAAEHISQFNEEARSPFVKKFKTILHPGEVNRIRELPQNKNIVATHTDSPEVLIWDVEAQPNRYAVLGAAESHADLIESGLVQKQYIAKVVGEFPEEEVKSKLPVLSSFTDATEGLWTHGWIVKIENHGCFVRFYNGVQGYAPRSELGLDPGSEVSSMYHVEQVVKCRVTSSVPATRRINLSFLVTPTRTSEDEDVKLGSIVADNHGIVSTMMELMNPGYKFVKLLVLDVENNNLILTAKYYLVNAAQHLRADASQVYPSSIVPGYICNIIDTGCFVRFLGRLTGFAPKNRAVDDHRAGLFDVFYVGQSVRSNIQDVTSETGRITLALKQSLCSSTDASFLQEYFILQEKMRKKSAKKDLEVHQTVNAVVEIVILMFISL